MSAPGAGNAQHRFNMNHYATKKSAAQSMLDVALLMANSSQLKTVLYYFWKDFFVCCNFIYATMCFLLFPLVKYDLNYVKQPRLNTMNNMATVFVFFTVLINIIITALGMDSSLESEQSLISE
uniref:Ninjurin 1 n=1 Tax=Sinocyclocheilus rhinocerous TaxID=307959 RepID=A0A673M1B9_9TELE